MQLSIECLRRFLGDGGLYFAESDCTTWNIVCENTPKNQEVIILATIFLAIYWVLKVILNCSCQVHYKIGLI